MTPEPLRTLTAKLLSKVDTMGRKIHRDETIIEQLFHEIALLKRHTFARRSEQISPAQGSLLDDLLDTDLEAIEAELDALRPEPVAPEPRQQPKRAPLPPQRPRTVVNHELENTQCSCGCQLQRIGEDISEKLDYTPGVFTVEQHVRGKWACRQFETLIQAPVSAQVIDKGIPTAGLLAHVMVAKFADHLPLYRQEKIFGRAGLAIPRSTLAQWVGQTGVQLQPLVDALREAVLAQRVVHADETFELHVRLQHALLTWYSAKNKVLPGRVRFGFPWEMPALKSIDGRYAVAALDQMIASLPRPTHASWQDGAL
ncbi:hypothetical protein PS627_00111 [Pseudomonas fluorescens]|nr:hypothetical protein PS627_00111 [Pseudomonas fluorescens]VVP68942.1 hypothetical protein PS910_00471 [Pseudomonas fluorescens]